MGQTTSETREYRHVGHLLPDADAVPRAVRDLVAAAARRGQRIVLACPAPLAGALRDGLPDGDVRTVAPVPSGRPPETVAEVAALVDRELPADGRLLLVTCVEPADGDWEPCLDSDALLNHVLAERPVDHLCLFPPDPGAGAPGPEEVARLTHPELLTDAGPELNDAYREPGELLRERQRRRGPDPLEETVPTLSLVDLDDMRTLRRALHRALIGTALHPDAAQDFVLAIDEVTTNATEHGVPPVDVQLWCSPDRMVCAITDRGVCFDDPLAGYGPAHGDMAVGGMGLWLARRSVDSLTASPADASGAGCTVRLVLNA
ncbi:ATP-binding protein [Modestobacter sp. NPDC049651]|uniref:ATP-binding protein n=1 Tax=unclassified Modestobacter TaxID=2643866 RepID=UPI0034007C51